MKKMISLILMICIVLSGCYSISDESGDFSGNDSLKTQPTTTETAKPEPTETPASELEKEIPEPTEIIPTPTPSSGYNNGMIDYSFHMDPDENKYKTILADLSLIEKGEMSFAVTEKPADWSGMQFTGFDNKDEVWGYDVRSCDISNEDISSIEEFSDLSFDTDTVWPDRLPKDFNPEKILEYNQNPGLGIRELHKKGYTGKGIGIAIIDFALLLDHEQYTDNLMSYDYIHCMDVEPDMHASGVASLAVGKDIGVAPDAKLYYIATTYAHYNDYGFEDDASIIADAIYRVLDINKCLPEDEKIRVISISKGYDPENKGYDEILAAIAKADSENIFVVSTSLDIYYEIPFMGLDRNYTNNPDDCNSYGPAKWLLNNFIDHNAYFQSEILVPMGSRTVAACTGTSDYMIGRTGGTSWAVPWLAGFYALCCQADKDVTPLKFAEIALDTGTTIEVPTVVTTYPFGKIINPEAVINKLVDQKKK